jgi:hypothetical protein
MPPPEPRPSRGYLPALLLLILVLLAPDFTSPDAVEMALAGRCLWRLPVDGLAGCVGAEPLFWPPAVPLLSGLASAVLSLPVAATLISLLASALLCRPLMSIAWRLSGTRAAWLAGPLLVAVPAFRIHAAAGDARPLALLALLSALALVISPDLTRRAALASGLLLALAMLSRPEALFSAGLLVGWAAWRRRERLWAVVAGILAPMIPYWIAISLLAGHPTLTGRSWLSRTTGWLTALPHPWLKQELGFGAWGTPLRVALTTTDAAPLTRAGTDLPAALSWLLTALPPALPLWLVGLALVGLVSLRDRWRLLVPLVLLAAPYAATPLLQAGRDDLLPLNNLLPVLVVGVLLATAGVERLLAHRAGWAAAAVALAWGLLTPPPNAALLADPAIFVDSEDWLDALLPPDTTVAATQESAQLLHERGIRRGPVPTPWSASAWLTGPHRADYLLLTTQDIPLFLGTLRELIRRDALQVIARRRVGEEWALLLRVTAPADEAPR